MENTFLTLLEISAGCAVVILIISLLSNIINRRFTSKWKYFIWLVIAVRLIIPFNPSFDIGQPKLEVNLPNTSVVVPVVQTPPAEEQLPEFIPPSTDEQITPVLPIQPEQKPVATVNLTDILWRLWLVGAVVFLGVHIASYATFKKKLLRWARPVSRESRIFITKDRLQKELGISSEVPVLICGDVTSPMMIGFFNSFLILPHEDYSDIELYFILRHELTHFKRHDIWYKLLMVLANALHWFNPAVWLMVRESNRDLEISCDSMVVRGADANGRKFYSETILSNVRKQSAATAFTTHFYGGKKSLKERFKNILNTKKRQKGLICFVAVILCIGLVGGAVSCSIADDAAPPSSEDSSVAEKDGLFRVTSFLDQEKMMQRLTNDYPFITDWEVVYEWHGYATEGNQRENGLYKWQGDSRYTCWALLSVEGKEGFDRVLICYANDFVLEQTEDGFLTAVPATDTTSYSYYYRGFEKDWQFGDCKGAELIIDDDGWAVWFPEKSEAFFFNGSMPHDQLRLEGITERPKVFFNHYPLSSEYSEPENCYILLYERENRNWGDGEFDYALYRNKKITIFEGVEDIYPSRSLLNETALTIETNSSICFYDLSQEDFGKPVKILGGNGRGLADTEVYTISDVFTDLAYPTRHCIMYYIKDEREWRFCTVDSRGEILCDFSTGLAVIDETITSIRFQKGLVYFSYRPDGAIGKATHYCVDARPNKNHTPQSLD